MNVKEIIAMTKLSFLGKSPEYLWNKMQENRYTNACEPYTYPTLSALNPLLAKFVAMNPVKNIMLKVPINTVNSAKNAWRFEKTVIILIYY